MQKNHKGILRLVLQPPNILINAIGNLKTKMQSIFLVVPCIVNTGRLVKDIKKKFRIGSTFCRNSILPVFWQSKNHGT